MCYTSLGIYESSLIFKRTLIKNVKIGQYWDVRQGLFKLTRDFDVCRAEVATKNCLSLCHSTRGITPIGAILIPIILIQNCTCELVFYGFS